MSSEFDQVTLQGTTYDIPKNATNPSWGEQLNDYLRALGVAFSTLVGPADIAETVAGIVNNQGTDTNIIGLSFDVATVRAAVVEYAIFRTTDSAVKKEQGVLQFLYDDAASTGFKWTITRDSNSDAGVTIEVTDAGQAVYQSDSMAGANYSGVMVYRARGILQS